MSAESHGSGGVWQSCCLGMCAVRMRVNTAVPVALRAQVPRSWLQVGVPGWSAPVLESGCVGTVFMLTPMVAALFYGSQQGELIQLSGPEVCLPHQ